MKTNSAGRELIKKFEGVRLKAYVCPAGVLTIGAGHTSAAGPPAVTRGMTITAEEADAILARDLAKFEKHVSSRLTRKVNANQFSALVSFCFNVGGGNFDKSSVLKAVNEGRFKDVPARLALWNKGGGKVLAGLVKRRAAEGALFSAPPVHAVKGPYP